MQKRTYSGIEIYRMIFACFIPFLHIRFPDSFILEIIRQYLSRLGVPFFFVVSGMFLSCRLKENDSGAVLKVFLKRILSILIIWLAIYTPLIIEREGFSFRDYLFKTPAYLWYLTALAVAIIPFCLLKNRTLLYICSFLLYIFGTVFGDTYGALFGVYPLICKTIVTARNGLFFGLPLLCIGELVWKGRKSTAKLVISALLLIAEITFVGIWGKAYDRSMYIFLPLFMLFCVRSIKEWNPYIENLDLGRMSSLIYLMQYGIISIIAMLLGTGRVLCFLTYFLVIGIPVCICSLLKNSKLLKTIC